jgi:hypothetical protein
MPTKLDDPLTRAGNHWLLLANVRPQPPWGKIERHGKPVQNNQGHPILTTELTFRAIVLKAAA